MNLPKKLVEILCCREYRHKPRLLATFIYKPDAANLQLLAIRRDKRDWGRVLHCHTRPR